MVLHAGSSALLFLFTVILVPFAVLGHREFGHLEPQDDRLEEKSIEMLKSLVMPTGEQRESLFVELGGGLFELAGSKVCDVGCDEEHPGDKPPDLVEGCKKFVECMELAPASEDSHETFPNFHKKWCTDTIEYLGALICATKAKEKKQETEEKPLFDPKSLLHTLSNVIEIVKAGHDHANFTECGVFTSQSSDGTSEPSDDPVQEETKDLAKACTKCLALNHRGGVTDEKGGYAVTSFACAWNEGEPSECVAAHVGNPQVTDMLCCGGKCPDTKAQVYGKDEGAKPAHGDETAEEAEEKKADDQSEDEADADDEAAPRETPAGESVVQLNQSRIWPFSSSDKPPAKKALLVGWQYPGTGSELAGTIPDIIRVFEYLTIDLPEDKRFKPTDITVINDGGMYYAGCFTLGLNREVTMGLKSSGVCTWNCAANEIELKGNAASPTRVLGEMQKIISELDSGDFFYFHYSGHGSSKRDESGDELNGLDQVLHFPNGEALVDDDFYTQLASIPAGVTVTAIVDACHSEGFSDLPFNYDPPTRRWCNEWTGLNKERPFPQATITYVSGSQNHQTSADVTSKHALDLLGIFARSGGALTDAMLRHWTNSQPFHAAMQKVLDDMKAKGLSQIPNVCAWPSLRDNQNFSPLDPDLERVRDAACGGAPRSELKAVVPLPCSHGGTDAQGNSHERQQGKIEASKAFFEFSEELSDAQNVNGLPREGWVDC